MAIFTRARKRHRILLLGAPSVGKTTLIYRLAKQPLPDSMVPTATAVLEKEVEAPGGHKFIFAEQKSESEDASAVAYIISSDDVNAGISGLKTLVESKLQPGIPILVLVNKHDLVDDENADIEKDIAGDIAPIITTSRSWGVRECSGTENVGLDGVMEWFETQLPMY